MPSISHNSSKSCQILTGRPYVSHTHPSPGISQLLLDKIFGLKGVLPRQMTGITEFGTAIVNIQIDQLVRRPLDNDAIKAGELEIRTKEAISLAGRCPTGKATLGNYRNGAPTRYPGSSQWPGSKNEAVPRV